MRTQLKSLLILGLPLTNFKDHRELLVDVGTPGISAMHYSDKNGWHFTRSFWWL